MVVAVLYAPGHICNTCGGTGWTPEDGTCEVCLGDGRLELYDVNVVVGFDPADPLAINTPEPPF